MLHKRIGKQRTLGGFLRLLPPRKGLLFLSCSLPLLLCSCDTEYITVLKNDSAAPINVRLSGQRTAIDADGTASGIFLCSTCKVKETAGYVRAEYQLGPNEELWLGRKEEVFHFSHPFGWDTVTVAASKGELLLTADTLDEAISQREGGRSCGDCGPPQVRDIISIK